MARLRGVSLQYRIAVGVIVGLVAILAGALLLADRMVGQVGDLVLAERLAVAGSIADTVDARLAHLEEELVELAGLEILRAGASSPQEERSHFEGFLAVLSDFAVIRRLSASGEIVWSLPADPDLVGATLASRADVAAALASGHIEMRLAAPEPTSAGSVQLAAPIASKAGMQLGFVTGELAVSELQSTLQLGTRAGGAVQVVDADGLTVGSEQEGHGGMAAEHAALVAPLVGRREAGVVIHDPAGAGAPHTVAYVPLESAAGGILLEDSVDPVLAVPAQMRTAMLLFGILAVVGGSVAAWLHARSVVRPLRDLTTVTAQIAAGRLDTAVETRREDEVGALATSFNAMRLRLQEAQRERDAWDAELERGIRDATTEAEQRNRELSAINDVLMDISRSHELIATLASALERLLDICGGDAGLIYLIDAKARGFAPVVHHGIPEDLARRAGALRLTRVQGRALMASDHGWIVDPGDPEAAGLPEAMRSPRYRSLMGTPLLSREERLGIILVGAQRTAGFGARDLRLLESLAGVIGVAVANTRLSEAVREKEQLRAQVLNEIISAQEGERKRISRELHDSTIQSLAGLLMKVRAALDRPQDTDGVRSALGEVSEEVGQTITDLRRAIVDLRPLALDDLGLVDAVRWYAQTRLEAQGIVCRVTVSGNPLVLPETTSTTIFRISQEAINNVAQHSRAKRARVEVRFAHRSVNVLVVDNGVGFSAASANVTASVHGRLGILGMQERAAMLGGTVTIATDPGHGTRVSVSVPIGGEG